MQVTWDYTKLANAYIKRPAYSIDAIDQMCHLIGLNTNSSICDIGAGTGHLTMELSKKGFNIKAIEPNDAMRETGIKRTNQFQNISWYKGTAEQTNQDNDQFDAVTFGSSFNVCDQKMALRESLRICKPDAWFACMWNHRDLDDPIQKNIETIIKTHVPNYDYGLRRQDQSPILKSSNLFVSIEFIQENVFHQQSIDECVEAWRSHGTLHRQVNEDDKLFNKIINEIEAYLQTINQQIITIPYVTRIWVAKFAKK